MLDAKFVTEHGTTPVLYWINDIYMSPILIHITYVLILKKLSPFKIEQAK